MHVREVPIVFPMLFLGLVGCGSSQDAQRSANPLAQTGAMDTNYRPGSHTIHTAGEDDDDASGMSVQAEQGTLDQGDVDRAIEGRWRALQGCYDRAGGMQHYVGGQVLLRFLVAPSGQVSDILVVENALGNYAIERCLVVEGRRITFAAPKGGKAAQFEYPIKFRSTGETAVVDWQPESIRDQIGPLWNSFTPCPSLGPEAVSAVVYIQPDGAIGSAGLVSAGPIDPEAGVCALEQVRKWRLSGDAGHVIRTSFAMRAGADSSTRAAVATKIKKPVRRRR